MGSRAKYQRTAYRGITEELAWTLVSEAVSLHRQVQADRKQMRRVHVRLMSKACRNLAKALRMLLIMFGKEDGGVVQVRLTHARTARRLLRLVVRSQTKLGRCQR